MSFDPEEAAQELHEQLDDESEVTLDELEDEFSDYADLYVGRDEAMRSIRNRLDNVDDINVDSGNQEPDEVTVDELDTDEQPVTLEVQVVSVYGDTHQSIRQKGRIGDQTGFTNYTEFKGSDNPTLEDGESYRIENAVTDEYNGEYSIIINEQTEVESLDRDVDVQSNDTTVTAPIVNIQRGSGLIERCPEDDCTYVVSDRACPEHGDVDGEDDLRIKAHLDDGQETRTVIIGRELTEELVDLTVEDAVELAREEMDRSVVEDRIGEELIGRYFRIEGLDYNDLIAQDVQLVESEPTARVDSLLDRADEIDL